ncbi:MAG: HlyD family efflux transporter periplasmic adaptor subunit [Pseudomonadota bacterium]
MPERRNGQWLKRLILAGTTVAVVGGLVFALQPKPTPVDIAVVSRGNLDVTISEEGVTRIREIYEVSAPVGGRVERSGLDVGDRVIKGETVIASIHPVEPPFLDMRTRSELSAAAEAANAAVGLATAEVSRVQSQLELARGDLRRARALFERRTISERAFENATTQVDVLEAQLTQANATLNLRRSELDSARARLIPPGAQPADPNAASCCMVVHAPVSGAVLEVQAESERVMTAGSILAEIGDPRDLEIVVDLLSADAVKIVEGARARVLDWGGGNTLHAIVRQINPVGFTKVSALGIEEQRVNAVLDFEGEPDAYARLGHDFRVFIEIVTEEHTDAIVVPLGALFRDEGKWATFRVNGGVADLVHLELDARNDQSAAVASGLDIDDQVVIHPPDSLQPGGRVVSRDGR